jgi:hypothetical protein
MQAQTTRTFQGNMHKLAGGLLIAATLAASAIGLATTSELDILGTGSSEQAPVTSQVYHQRGMGEGWIALGQQQAATAGAERSVEELWFSDLEESVFDEVTGLSSVELEHAGGSLPAERSVEDFQFAETNRAESSTRLEAPQGEGLPMIELEPNLLQDTPQGEGLPMNGPR